MTATAPYVALALQTRCVAVNRCTDTAGARERMRISIERVHRQVLGAKSFIGTELRLVVLPEYFLSGYPLGESVPAWAEKAALAPDGDEYLRLGALCRDAGVFLSGNVYETDPHFPGLYFQTSFVLDDEGQCVLRYRRLVSLFAPTPHDVWDRYLQVYGLDAVFPVADTPLGRLACVASEEILYPEIARTLALRGAEVLLHSSSEIGSPRLTPKDVAKRARAYENSCWVVSANTAGIDEVDIPGHSVDGMSKLVDPRGEVQAEAGFGESMVAHAVIDIGALRQQRLRPGMGNLLSRQRLELFAATYGGSIVAPNGLLIQGALQIPERGHFAAQQRASIQSLVDKDILRRD